MVKVWDIWVRLFHWSFAITISYLLISGETGYKFIDWHRMAGEVAICLVLFRLIWGFTGSSTARLLPLFRSPRSAVRHLLEVFRSRSSKSAPEHGSEYGHNASGGYAVLALLALIAIQASTGMFIADEDEFVEGRFYGVASGTVSDFLYQVHHYNAHVIQVLVLVHIAMIFFYLLYARINLIKTMFTGSAVRNSVAGEDEPVLKSVWLGLAVAVFSGLVYYFLFAA